ncbi:MerR family transcriptional regulator [Aquabacterium sp.]|uniref:MerR family transcriptional regulator n=1 Tax=Aquabacterium sp. TaxID=1872578 RepID=UPI0025C442E4|nr:MerR family transcriptional regulator [Aquabacterium sp.]
MGSMDRVEGVLPPIPAKRYFTIGEVSELCLVKPYVLRYWEQEFVQLKPMKRRGNRRYYQHHEVLLIRRIRELLYEQGFTISGARNQLAEMGVLAPAADELDGVVDEPLSPARNHAGGMPPVSAGVLNGAHHGAVSSGLLDGRAARALQASTPAMADAAWMMPALPELDKLSPDSVMALREALLSIRDLLS